MKILTSLIFALASVPAVATGPVGHLPGVSDEETTIPGPVVEFQLGKGDVIFARDRTDRWYRVQLNQGYSRGAGYVGNVAFEQDIATSRIDTFSAVSLGDGRVYRIDSIRQSAAPPQKNSRSPVTLD